jgi:serine/threonine protein kinase
MATRALGRDPLVGVQLGRYRIVEKIGAGGMGVVYRAFDEHLARDVAIKVLSSGTFSDESARKRFHKEALILSQLNHPSIAIIYDFDTQEGLAFLVMEYIDGISLSEKLAHRSLADREIFTLGTQLAEGISAAHERGVIHRDLKPGNLRLSADGRLKILDFGLAKLRVAVSTNGITQSLSDAQALAGTLPYMAPEQLLGEEIDARTDIHGIGSVLYEMATGQRPFTEVEPSQLVSAILRRPPVRPSMLNHELSPGLEQVITKCLEKEPGNRYQSAKELLVDLRRSRREIEPGAISVEPRERAKLASFRSYKVGLGVVGSIAIVLLAVFLFLSRNTQHLPSSTPAVAVLPFADLSPGKDQEYFSDGLAEELLNSLVKIPGLHVAARTSSFQFKGKNEDLRTIGKKLNVSTVLEGSVRKQGERLRISAQLVQVSDGFQLWSEAYDRDLKDVFAVQEDIASSVATSLRLTLIERKSPSPHSTSVEAYNDYLEGKYFHARPTKENLEKAIAYYEQAVRLDPKFAPVWAALSKSHSIKAGAYGPVPEYEAAREAAERALSIDPNLADAHAALGEVKLDYDWDWAGADSAYQKALTLENGNAEIVERAASVAATLNRFEQALVLSRKAVDLDPLRASAYHVLAFNAWWAGQFDEAEASVRKGLELDPEFPWFHTLLGRVYLARSRPQDALVEAEHDTSPGFRLQGLALAYFALGRKQESDRALAELVSSYQSLGAFQIAEVHAYRGEADEAFKWLQRAYAQRDPALPFVKGDPLLTGLKRDPRYDEFLAKMRLHS